MSELGTCRSCHKPIRWVRMAGSGKENPLDPAPRADGNIVLNEDGEAVYLGKRETNIDGGRDRYVSHFATCEFAAQHRRSA